MSIACESSVRHVARISCFVVNQSCIHSDSYSCSMHGILYLVQDYWIWIYVDIHKHVKTRVTGKSLIIANKLIEAKSAVEHNFRHVNKPSCCSPRIRVFYHIWAGPEYGTHSALMTSWKFIYLRIDLRILFAQFIYELDELYCMM